ncbi:MAG TPA: TAT-variant-translocated molybdopterin oxidoreductase [Flavisolibacter sp.]|nr:TAT-variant-translocated molybdopterin oxidoreductase [Flavisolibacter sp.]
MSDKKYWTSFAALKNKEELQKLTQNEFAEDLPFEDLDGKGLLDAKTPRRDFLKYLGFSTAAATLAASCKTPVRKAVPFVNRPENITPGVAKYYASTYVQDGDVVPVVVKVRDGRPIKIEGNELYPFTKGGTSPRAQASVLDLYDMYRLPHPKRNTGKGFEEVASFDQLDSQIGGALGAARPVVLLTSTIVSPSTQQIITDFLGKYPGSRHVQYDAVSYSGMLLANESTMGRRAIPSYQFDRAKVIVSLGADFLGTWLSPVEFARQYSVGRKIDEKNPVMSKHYQFESFLSMTGACADERFTHRPSETGLVANALLAAVSGSAAPNVGSAALTNGIAKVAKDLMANRGAALVVAGSNDPNVQIIVNAINNAIGAYGSTINTGVTLNFRQGVDADMVNLVNAMNAGQVGALLIYGANPAYDYFEAEKFKAGIKKVRLSVSFNEKMDETTELCQYSIPTHHYLESWGDAEPRTGYITFIQPTIFPLFKTRPFQTSLLKWTGNNTDYETYFRTYWTGKLGGQQAFDAALQDGVLLPGGKSASAQQGNVFGQTATSPGQMPVVLPTVQTVQQTTDTINANGTTERISTGVPPTTAGGGSFNGGGVVSATTALSSRKASGGNEIVLYQNVAMLTGKQAGNPWLLELPDPITRATWDNYAMISSAKAKALGIDYESTDYEYYQGKPLIDITVNNKKITLPALVVPGMDPNTIAVAVGYGRSERFAKATAGVGQNVYPFARFNGTTIEYSNDVTISDKTLGDYNIARVQMHNSYEGRSEVLKETTLATFKQRPDEFKEWREELYKEYSPISKDSSDRGTFAREGTMYPDPRTRVHEIKWGMAIDLNSCIGCGACVVACHTENNVPVVGKNEVLRAHEMHWLRIDRYYVTNEHQPDQLESVIFQPMLCQHCDNAPCENVCPVAATMHNSEGINQMAYNRCIGTRYCANNCPYKVRRFNWGDYTGASTHGVGGPSSGTGKLNEAVHQMNDELTRMVLNPDVVTRSRGVMEKCTFCVQRTQAGKLKAKMEDRKLAGDEVQSACAQACPTSAIVFGNANDETSQISQIRKTAQQRQFYVLEQLHTLPNITYLAKIRNTDEIIEGEEKMGEHARETKQEVIPSQHEPAKESH